MKNLLFIALLLFTLSSCENEKGIAPTDISSVKLTSKDVTLQNGVLKFASKEHLHSVVGELAGKENLENWYSSHEFVSLLKRQKSISNHEYDKIGETGEFGELGDVLTFRGEGDEKRLTTIVKLNSLAALLNSKSYVILGDSAYHVGAKEVTSFYIGNDSNKLSTFLENKNISGSRTYEIKHTSFSNARTKLGVYQETRDKRRIYAANEVDDLGAMGASLVTYVEYLKKNWIGWSLTEANYLSIVGTATTNEYGGSYLHRKVEGWNVEGVSMGGMASHWNIPTFYNYSASIECLIFGEASLFVRAIPQN